jgi:hypothetical protein
VRRRGQHKSCQPSQHHSCDSAITCRNASLLLLFLTNLTTAILIREKNICYRKNFAKLIALFLTPVHASR